MVTLSEVRHLMNVNAVMNMSSVHPEVFSGRHDEQFHIFVKKFELYCEFSNIEGKAKLVLLSLLLGGLDSIFYETLNDSVQNNFTKLNAAFIEHFQCDLQFINSDILDSITHKSDENIEKYITRVLTMCDSMQYNDNSKVRTLLRGLNPNMKVEVLMTCPREMPSTINRMRHIYYCNTMKMEDRTTSEETTTGATLQRIGDLTTKLCEIVHVRERMEDESRGYLGSELKTSGIHCQNYHDNYEYPVYPPRYRQHQRFHRDASSYRPSVPDYGVSNINTSSPLSTIFGVQSCAVMHGRTQRVNRRHSRVKQHRGLSRYRVNHVMFGDRRGVDRCDLRRKWYVN